MLLRVELTAVYFVYSGSIIPWPLPVPRCALPLVQLYLAASLPSPCCYPLSEPLKFATCFLCIDFSFVYLFNVVSGFFVLSIRSSFCFVRNREQLYKHFSLDTLWLPIKMQVSIWTTGNLVGMLKSQG
jgi:hypothetical protein